RQFLLFIILNNLYGDCMFWNFYGTGYPRNQEMVIRIYNRKFIKKGCQSSEGEKRVFENCDSCF
ncbi:MAG: hypothetical protein LUQ50_10015, partial [Methanospirillum sp.]|uniref:hypothetical protein n=1 Tax=Methanospirillum sp. TaxID=45200 RepID=UPI002374B8DA